ncbi:hypothetical protein WN55_07531 [Dufourea novaeangliae]|uniref:Uncharacterized protein n=1 Tax=Dufourea novaeangliae TaxID=178035 RepID=A0A154P6C8_DUFNO|nr:hypothetical protein WN55_07531 [Dufourea novaeangliae]
MIMGVREELEAEEGEEEKREGVMMKKVKIGGTQWWRIIGVYVNKDIDRKLEELKEWIEDRERGVRVIVGGI